MDSRRVFSLYKELKIKLNICELRDEIAQLSPLAEELSLAAEVELEIQRLNEQIKALEHAILRYPDDHRNAIFEIQAGVGGDEAALFVADLYKMYTNFAKANGLIFEETDFTPGNIGGFKEISFIISGRNVFGKLKYESGLHRVQRVPLTETKGRVHTSIVSVVVLPELEIDDTKINKCDVEINVYNSGGPGGQNTNKSLNAVELIHKPTGITACSQMKSYTQNLKLAWQVLIARVNNFILHQQLESEVSRKKEIRGTGARSEKIRTYNFPQDRVTDHRCKEKYSLKTILSGNMNDMLNDLILENDRDSY